MHAPAHLTPRLPKPINIPGNLDTRHSELILKDFDTQKWLSRRSNHSHVPLLPSLTGERLVPAEVLRDIKLQLVEFEITETRKEAEELVGALELDRMGLLKFKKFLNHFQETACDQSTQFSHRKHKKLLPTFSIINFKRKILVSSFLHNREGAKFISQYNRIFCEPNETSHKKKDFRYIDISDRLKLVNSRKETYIVKGFGKSHGLVHTTQKPLPMNKTGNL